MMQGFKITNQNVYNQGYGTTRFMKDTFPSLLVLIWYMEYCNAFANVLLSCNNNYHNTLL